MVSILLIRPDAQALAFADAFRGRFGCGVRPIFSPIMEIVFSGALPTLSADDVLIFTSPNGVQAYVHQMSVHDLGNRRCYVVGQSTAKTARAAGMQVLVLGMNTADLTQQILGQVSIPPLLHIRGEHIAGSLASDMRAAGAVIREAILYQQVATPLTDEALKHLQGEIPLIIPLFSPRSTRLFFSQGSFQAPLLVASLSQEIAAEVPEGTCNVSYQAVHPHREAMLDILEDLIDIAKSLEGGKPAQ